MHSFRPLNCRVSRHILFYIFEPRHFFSNSYCKMASAWVNFVKAHWKKVGGSYSSAMKSAAPLWRKQKKGSADPVKKKVKRRRKR